MRLGAYAPISRRPEIAVSTARTEVFERHRHRYEVNTAYRARLEAKGLLFAGMAPMVRRTGGIRRCTPGSSAFNSTRN